MKRKTTYEQRGVSSQKPDVHRATANLDKGLYPGAFCKILSDPDNKSFCRMLHADTAGTKVSLAYLVWKLRRDIEMVKGVAVDSLVMNADDVGCVGATRNLLFNQIIGRNWFRVQGDVVQALIEAAQEFCDLLCWARIPCDFAGGETADVGDLSRTFDVASSVFVRMKQRDVIDASNMAPGDLIVGFSSTGKADWEATRNSGMGDNGLTNARHDMLLPKYRRHTETYAPEMPRHLAYRGPHDLFEHLPEDTRFTVAEALLSPTRTYLPLIKRMLEEIGRKHFHGLIHCSGGGQTKIAKFGRPGNRYVKGGSAHALFPVPAVFRAIQKAARTPWKEMYEVFNMGHRLEAVVPNERIAIECVACANDCGIDAQIIGHVEHKLGPGPNKVKIRTPYGEFDY